MLRRPASRGLDSSRGGGRSTTPVVLDSSRGGGRSTTRVASNPFETAVSGEGSCSDGKSTAQVAWFPVMLATHCRYACNPCRRPTRSLLASGHSIRAAGELLLGNVATRPSSRVVTQLVSIRHPLVRRARDVGGSRSHWETP